MSEFAIAEFVNKICFNEKVHVKYISVDVLIDYGCLMDTD